MDECASDILTAVRLSLQVVASADIYEAATGGARPDLKPAQIGCWLAHVGVWQRIVAENVQTALIPEDDIDWDVQVHAVAEQLSRQLLDGETPLTRDDEETDPSVGLGGSSTSDGGGRSNTSVQNAPYGDYTPNSTPPAFLSSRSFPRLSFVFAKHIMQQSFPITEIYSQSLPLLSPGRQAHVDAHKCPPSVHLCTLRFTPCQPEGMKRRRLVVDGLETAQREIPNLRLYLCSTSVQKRKTSPQT